MSRITLLNEQYVELSEYPNKIVISSPKNSQTLFEEYLTSHNYDIIGDKQLGSCYTISKNGVEEQVYFSVNKYYSKWVWE